MLATPPHHHSHVHKEHDFALANSHPGSSTIVSNPKITQLPSHSHSQSQSHSHRPKCASRYAPRESNGYVLPTPDQNAQGLPTVYADADAVPPLSKNDLFSRTPNRMDFIYSLRLLSIASPLFIATTLLLISASHSSYPQTDSLNLSADTVESPPVETAFGVFLGRISTAAAMSSGTLFVFAFLRTLRKHFIDPTDEGGGRFIHRNSRVVSVMECAVAAWICYFAALELGGVRAAVVVMSCMATKFGLVGFNGLLKRKAMLGAICVAAGWDLWRGAEGKKDAVGTIVAYVSLLAGMVGLRSPWRSGIKSQPETNVSLFAACGLAITSVVIWMFGSEPLISVGGDLGFRILTCAIGAAGMALGVGVNADAACGAGVFTAIAGGWVLGLIDGYDLLSEAGLGSLALAAISFDMRSSDCHSYSHDHAHSHGSNDDHHHPSASPPSAVTIFLLQQFEGVSLIHSILLEKDSRRISYFMCLNFAFMVVQFLYGFLTGSLGLISDSVHMFFDCIALGVGVSAAVMSKWPPSTRYPYGLGKMDTLAGFANGIFLMLISVEIIWEAVERLHNPKAISRLGELFIVSIAGFAVNMVGIFAFDHAHAHGSHGHGHSHGHSHNPAHSHSLGHSHSPNLGNDESKSIHAHSHGGDNMHGIYLHILADLLGSVSVVISTVLIHYTNWPGFDPLASMLIAIMIFASAIPLVKSSAKNLLLTVNTSTEYNLREAISGISALPGVRAYQATRFWETGDGMLRGVVHVTAEGDRQAVKRRVEDWLNTGLERVDVTVVVERGDDPQCWCQKD